MSSTSTITIPACPDWRTEQSGHGSEGRSTATLEPVRNHCHETNVGDHVWAAVLQSEFSEVGGTVRINEPFITLEVDDTLSHRMAGPQARQIAADVHAALLAAADVWDKASGQR